jgi:hypothetical protein
VKIECRSLCYVGSIICSPLQCIVFHAPNVIWCYSERDGLKNNEKVAHKKTQVKNFVARERESERERDNEEGRQEGRKNIVLHKRTFSPTCVCVCVIFM